MNNTGTDTDIFLPENNYNIDIAHKLTYTNIMDSIPKDKLIHQILDWQNKYTTEWRWRFLKFKDGEQNRFITEISYINSKDADLSSDKRIYLNRYGDWVSNIYINGLFDNYVVEEYYVYV